MNIIGKLNNGAFRIFQNKKVCIGDIVKITDGGEQYSTYTTAYRYFWGNEQRYSVPYSFNNHCGDTNVTLNDIENRWIVANMAVHDAFKDEIILHLRSRDFKNCVVSIHGVRVVKPIKRRPLEIKIEQIHSSTTHP